MDVKSTWHQMDHVSWSLGLLSKLPLGGRRNTKPGDHGTPNTHNHWLLLFHNAWGPTRIKTHWNSFWLRVRSHMTSHYTWGPMITLHEMGGDLGMTFGHFLLGSHNFMVMALGSWLVCEVALICSFTAYASQEPLPWNYESPKDIVQRPSQDTSRIT